MDFTTYKGFDVVGFWAYLDNQFKYDGFARHTVENIIDFGMKHERISKGQFVEFLYNMLSQDLELGEITQFMDDDCLTLDLITEKNKWIASHD